MFYILHIKIQDIKILHLHLINIPLSLCHMICMIDKLTVSSLPTLWPYQSSQKPSTDAQYADRSNLETYLVKSSKLPLASLKFRMCAPRYGASDFASRWGVRSKYMVPMLCCSSLRKTPAKQKPNHWWAPGVSVETPLHLAKQSKPSHTKPTGQDVTKIFSRTMPNQ